LKLNFIDIFAGCGGLSEGFMQTNRYRGLAHVEWALPMAETLRERLKMKWRHSSAEAVRRVVHFDMQETSCLLKGSWTKELLKKYGETNSPDFINGGLDDMVEEEQVDVIIGGPPCQAYSIAGRAQDNESMKDDYRNFLFESFVKVVDRYKPKVFVFENVPGMLSAMPGDKLVTERIHEAFQEIGYEIDSPSNLPSRIMSADDFGVAQKRRRVIIIGTRTEDGQLFKELYRSIDNEKVSKGNRQTVADAIGHLPGIMPLTPPQSRISHYALGLSSPKYHTPRYHNPRDVAIFKEWVEEGMNSSSTEDKLSFYEKKVGKSSGHVKYRNLEWDSPSPTIVAHLYKDGLMFIHPDQDQARTLTIKEAALLQSFPPDFEFLGSAGDCYKMIGNAVPPLMARSIAQGIAKVIS
jgi:DNA (cytosine-5)-methyltransferase 1